MRCTESPAALVALRLEHPSPPPNQRRPQQNRGGGIHSNSRRPSSGSKNRGPQSNNPGSRNNPQPQPWLPYGFGQQPPMWPAYWTPPPSPYPTQNWSSFPNGQPHLLPGCAKLINNQTDNFVSFDALDPTQLGEAFQAMTMEPGTTDNQWLMDSGASDHLIGNQDPDSPSAPPRYSVFLLPALIVESLSQCHHHPLPCALRAPPAAMSPPSTSIPHVLHFGSRCTGSEIASDSNLPGSAIWIVNPVPLIPEVRISVPSIPAADSISLYDEELPMIARKKGIKWPDDGHRMKTTTTVKMAKAWISGDENAKQMLSRVLKERPLLHLPNPLHRVPLGVNNILEIMGPSPSAKTEILLQLAVNCILPKNQHGVQYGGLEHTVLFLDLDCRLDIYRLSQSLKLKITEANRLHKTKDFQNCVYGSNQSSCNQLEHDQTDVFTESMRRFLYTRCYDSFEFLSVLKVLNYKLTGNGFHVLMIDNIGAFHSIDRGFSSLPQGIQSRKNIGLQSVFETVVQEIKKLLDRHSMIVLATKTVTNQVKRSYSSRVSGGLKNTYREYMPLTWQSFVTHRVLVRPSDDKKKCEDRVCYSAEWLLPAFSISDEFIRAKRLIKKSTAEESVPDFGMGDDVEDVAAAFVRDDSDSGGGKRKKFSSDSGSGKKRDKKFSSSNFSDKGGRNC
ncbi:hypothetical protein E3N88_23237 [Mikania micrantha]|uniref:RecA family profile 1 domain-containing protein n=1 Tax=Mikania micrantha TaxID=192012 RepID=A0A5N6NCQ6_9ASTR|nr:hypothetical protein E3N88_23237 [Mikania micrantha]